MFLSDFDFDLPKELIAVNPIEPRESAKLLHINSDRLDNLQIRDLPSLLSENDILVFNDTKVIPSKLILSQENKKISINLYKKTSAKTWLAFAKPARKITINQKAYIGDNFECKILSKQEGCVEIFFDYTEEEFFAKIFEHGLMPLPPYIKRSNEDEEQNKLDNQNYQTIFAKNLGAVAAPTASLHFTLSLMEKIKAKNINIAYVTLHVGAGTFLPVKCENIKDHIMHEEYCNIDQINADKINRVKASGGKIVAVGTTSLRILESVADDKGELKAFSGNTDIFITPGYKFKIIDKLITNFHLPKSTLFMLVAALGGLDNLKKAYDHAIKNNYRFFSYGDACFIERQE